MEDSGDGRGEGALKRTALVEVHRGLGAKMVPFAGFLMPVQYESITREHRAVRERVGLFDISHMGEFELTGSRALEAVQRVTVNDASALVIDQAQYSALVNEAGGIVDDLVVYRLAEERWMLVVNASNVAKDWEHVRAHLSGDGVELRDRSDEVTLLAVQGPAAAAVVSAVSDVAVDDLAFYWKRDGDVAGVPVILSRTGYTGEDGFELYFDRGGSEAVWSALMDAGAEHGIEPCGLGARDTLRLEMKYALYGNDIDEGTNPYEAGLGWIVKLDKGDFVGRDALARIVDEGPRRRLVGFRLHERGIPRAGYPVRLDGEEVSEVRSGAMSPTLGYGIGTCYLPKGRTKAGTPLAVEIRDRALAGEVVKTPFYTGGSLRR
ncbi:MAG TPA: glycine cleavage system aminomethyltransferase GcvT [Gemmatimonadota bacterium]|nr:glycine cleavage system aminomethyltransferase GcvT [Gemmatimonadota bacterium]